MESTVALCGLPFFLWLFRQHLCVDAINGFSAFTGFGYGRKKRFSPHPGVFGTTWGYATNSCCVQVESAGN
jgi:hypothetical protein